MLRGKEGVYMLEPTRAWVIAIVQSFSPGTQLRLVSLAASPRCQAILHIAGNVKAVANVLTYIDIASVSMPYPSVTDKACIFDA